MVSGALTLSGGTVALGVATFAAVGISIGAVGVYAYYAFKSNWKREHAIDEACELIIENIK